MAKKKQCKCGRKLILDIDILRGTCHMCVTAEHRKARERRYGSRKSK